MRWECAKSPLLRFPRAVGREGNGSLFSSLSTRPAFPPLLGDAKKVTAPMLKRSSCLPRISSRRSLRVRDASFSPIRCTGFAAGDLFRSGNGLHGFRYANEHGRTCLLPHDEESVRASGDAGIAWLLPEDATQRSQQCARDKNCNRPSDCGFFCLVSYFGSPAPYVSYRRMG